MLITEDAAYCGRGIMMTIKKQRERNASVQLSFFSFHLLFQPRG